MGGWLKRQEDLQTKELVLSLVSSRTLQQELKLNPVLFKAADFNEGFLLPMVSSFTGLDVTTILLLPTA